MSQEPGFMPERVWEEKVRGRRALMSEFRLTWFGLRRWLLGAPAPTVPPLVADRLRVARMALDVAELLRFNDRPANYAICRETMRILDCENPAAWLDGDEKDSGVDVFRDKMRAFRDKLEDRQGP